MKTYQLFFHRLIIGVRFQDFANRFPNDLTHQFSCIVMGTRLIDDNRQEPTYSSLLNSNEQFLVQFCSDPNNESDPSSEYSLLGLTHVMNHCLGQKFIIWVKINCLDMSLKPGTGIPRPRTVDGITLYTYLQNKRMRRCGVAPPTNNFRKT